jgi:tRNA threonylcarbamoyladenosine biosynthesis protein TsaE
MIKGVAAGLKVKDVVRSPSFVLATEYDGFVSGQPAKIYHIDLYRVSHPSELEEVGFSDYMRDDAITLIEWPDRAGTSLPADATRVELEVTGPQRRTIKISQATA